MDGNKPRKPSELEGREFQDKRRANGIVSTEDKIFPRPLAVTQGLSPLLFHQPMLPLHRQQPGMQHFHAPYLTQASLFFSPQLINSHQLPYSQQQIISQRGGVIHQVASLVRLTTEERLQQELNGSSREQYSRDRPISSTSERSQGSPEAPKSQPMKVIHQVSRDEKDYEQDDSPLSQSMSCDSMPSTPKSEASPQAPIKSPETPPSFSAASPRPVVNEICAICLDKATGQHYGVTSCEGCKGFFKRSVQNKKDYTCRNLTKDCPIDKRHRNRCQYCRFQKCIQAGMIKEAVREDRTPGGKHKSSLLRTKSVQDAIPCKMRRTSSTSSCSSVLSSATTAAQVKPTKEYIEVIDELIGIYKLDNQSCDDCPGCKETGMKEKTLAHLTQLAEQQLVRCASWFKHLKLLKGICELDQQTLVTNVWVELMLANLIKESENLENKAKLCDGQILDFETAEITGIGDILQRVVQMAAKFREFQLEKVEIVCMKMIILLNPDLPGLRNQQLIEQLQDKVHSALQEHINLAFPREPNRFGNILLRLPELRSIGTKSLERLFMLNLTGQIHPSTSLSDLLHTGKR